MINQKYGVVYTPNSLADFVTGLLCRFFDSKLTYNPTFLDPACGECALLRSISNRYGQNARFVGIDVDKEVINNSKDSFELIHNDAILPNKTKDLADQYWLKKLSHVDAIIANPPWSSEKIYDKNTLIKSGYTLVDGQYDSYVLFIELAYKLLSPGGVMGFIIPDSLFDSQNENLRKFLASKMQILVIARLGEKIFEDVNRATTVIVCKKEFPKNNSITECFRLSTDERRLYLAGKGTLDYFFNKNKHVVSQSRFLKNNACLFDIDTRIEEEELVKKISTDSICWTNTFCFGRGVEISKGGNIVYCPICGQAQGYSKKHMQTGEKTCVYCSSNISVSFDTVDHAISAVPSVDCRMIYVGENIQRYCITGNSYIKLGIDGINYKPPQLYDSPKLLVRKTGLGIYAAIDYTGSLTSQTVYILKYPEACDIPLEYYLALINSRVVYFYYLKVYGENEWKSHPYLTKQIIFSLPIKPYSGSKLDKDIIRLACDLQNKYDYETDIMLEKLIMKKYGLNRQERNLIVAEMNRLPDLSAINNMKMENK